MGIGEVAQDLEGLVVVALHAVALGEHLGGLPLGDRIALLGGEIQDLEGRLLLALLIEIEALLERFLGRGVSGLMLFGSSAKACPAKPSTPANATPRDALHIRIADHFCRRTGVRHGSIARGTHALRVFP